MIDEANCDPGLLQGFAVAALPSAFGEETWRTVEFERFVEVRSSVASGEAFGPDIREQIGHVGRFRNRLCQHIGEVQPGIQLAMLRAGSQVHQHRTHKPAVAPTNVNTGIVRDSVTTAREAHGRRINYDWGTKHLPTFTA